MRRRIVEVNQAEVGRFRREAARVEPKQQHLSASVGERAIQKQVARQERQRPEHHGR
jgi:hypothetical protein